MFTEERKEFLRFDDANLMYCKLCMIFMLHTFKRHLLHVIALHQARPLHDYCWSTTATLSSDTNSLRGFAMTFTF